MMQSDWPGYVQAAATLVTGLAAVTAAVIVGKRQAGIADKQAEIAGRQSEILSHQVLLDELKLRSDLFDRRFAVYQATAKLLSEVLVDAANASDETVRAFLKAIDQSRFLFHPAVHDRLEQMWRDYTRFGAIKSMIAHGSERPDWPELVDREAALMESFAERLRTLSELFGDELVLAATHVATP